MISESMIFWDVKKMKHFQNDLENLLEIKKIQFMWAGFPVSNPLAKPENGSFKWAHQFWSRLVINTIIMGLCAFTPYASYLRAFRAVFGRLKMILGWFCRTLKTSKFLRTTNRAVFIRVDRQSWIYLRWWNFLNIFN